MDKARRDDGSERECKNSDYISIYITGNQENRL